ncbi:TolC family protein [Prolixibacteraceae bacterium Z1-6]|uniref:TolC family protein n=1 Tax=Draconibacterium aestuarii TaxID=2998507 RepID=A0A9X3F3J2_9BACT|nr:TolC family protein [Prolixibacteraceae bacterium Z1-6]
MKQISIILMIVCSAVFASAQEHAALRLSIKDAEQLFLDQNMELLAEKYNIKISEAERLQARAWPNPEFSAEIAMWDKEDKKWFRSDYTAQRVFEVSQMIETAGKRKKRTEVADNNIKIAELEFYEVMLELKSELRLLFADIYYLNEKKARIDAGAGPLSNLIEGYSKLHASGNFARAELTRLKSLQRSIDKERLSLNHELIELTTRLKLLLNLNPGTDLNLIMDGFKTTDPNALILANLIEQALNYRVDYQRELYLASKAGAEVRLAKAEGIPDLNIGAMYDRRGAEQWDYVGLTFSMDIPVFDRNKGEIKRSEFEKEQAEINVQKMQLTIESELFEAYAKLSQTHKTVSNIEADYMDNLDQMLAGALTSFEKRSISLIEFIDYFESYTESLEDIYDLQLQLHSDMENMNFVSGYDLEN